MLKVKCLLDFYCLSGKLRFESGKEYPLINGVIECGNYHLHYSDAIKYYFDIIKPNT